MIYKYILCKYAEDEYGEVKLIRLKEFHNEDTAQTEAVAFYREDNTVRLVLLTELVYPQSTW